MKTCSIILKSTSQNIFDQDQKIPDAYALISRKEFQEKLESLRKIFLEKKIESELARIVFFPIKQFGNVPEKRVITFPRTYMSLTNSKWDESNNIFTNIFIKSISKINRDLISSDDCGA